MKPGKKLSVHFIGIGGIGVSALAQYYRAMGWEVTGSDATRSEITQMLEKRKIRVFIGHRAAHIHGAARVIYSAAVRTDNPEYVAARRKHIPCISYAEAVGELTKIYHTIAVSGTHGKSTTTALIGLILMRAGLDPTIIVGTKLKELGGSNFRLGKSTYLVLEADEFNRSFHEYYPDIAIVTNIDADHLDTYKTFRGVVAGFKTFLRNVSEDGFVIANGSNAAVRNGVRGMRKPRVILFKEKKFKRHNLSIPGEFNQMNAEAAWQAVKLLGVSRAVTEEALYAYRGAWRRLELLKPGVFSDYAHHPAEIKVTLAALREKYPRRRLVCIFQPHLQDRLTRLFREFANAFVLADAVILLPLYKVKGREQGKGKTSRDLAAAVKKPQVVYAGHISTALRLAEAEQKKGSVVVLMSAGDLDAEARQRFRL